MIPNIYFETEQEFIEQMYVNAYVINAIANTIHPVIVFHLL